jgi:hypothetical protein
MNRGQLRSAPAMGRWTWPERQEFLLLRWWLRGCNLLRCRSDFGSEAVVFLGFLRWWSGQNAWGEKEWLDWGIIALPYSEVLGGRALIQDWFFPCSPSAGDCHDWMGIWLLHARGPNAQQNGTGKRINPTAAHHHLDSPLKDDASRRSLPPPELARPAIPPPTPDQPCSAALPLRHHRAVELEGSGAGAGDGGRWGRRASAAGGARARGGDLLEEEAKRGCGGL